jgi:hypothetical protein
MSANIYSIESLLVGKHYRSRSLEGEIVSAEKHPRSPWYGSNTESYLVVVRTINSYKDHYRTLAVKVGE